MADNCEGWWGLPSDMHGLTLRSEISVEEEEERDEEEERRGRRYPEGGGYFHDPSGTHVGSPMVGMVYPSRVHHPYEYRSGYPKQPRPDTLYPHRDEYDGPVDTSHRTSDYPDSNEHRRFPPSSGSGYMRDGPYNQNSVYHDPYVHGYSGQGSEMTDSGPQRPTFDHTEYGKHYAKGSNDPYNRDPRNPGYNPGYPSEYRSDNRPPPRHSSPDGYSNPNRSNERSSNALNFDPYEKRSDFPNSNHRNNYPGYPQPDSRRNDPAYPDCKDRSQDGGAYPNLYPNRDYSSNRGSDGPSNEYPGNFIKTSYPSSDPSKSGINHNRDYYQKEGPSYSHSDSRNNQSYTSHPEGQCMPNYPNSNASHVDTDPHSSGKVEDGYSHPGYNNSDPSRSHANLGSSENVPSLCDPPYPRSNTSDRQTGSSYPNPNNSQNDRNTPGYFNKSNGSSQSSRQNNSIYPETDRSQCDPGHSDDADHRLGYPSHPDSDHVQHDPNYPGPNNSHRSCYSSQQRDDSNSSGYPGYDHQSNEPNRAGTQHQQNDVQNISDRSSIMGHSTIDSNYATSENPVSGTGYHDNYPTAPDETLNGTGIPVESKREKRFEEGIGHRSDLEDSLTRRQVGFVLESGVGEDGSEEEIIHDPPADYWTLRMSDGESRGSIPLYSPQPNSTGSQEHEDSIAQANWVRSKGAFVPSGAVEAGKDKYNITLYVARARHLGHILPASLNPIKSAAYSSWQGKQLAQDQYEVLTNTPVVWKKSNDGEVPEGALPVGLIHDEDIYMGRVEHEGLLIPGRVDQREKCLFIAHNGTELSFNQYEVLVISK